MDITEKHKAAEKMINENPKQMIELMAKEIVRLHKLCKDNNIDPLPPGATPGASLSVTPKITVFPTKEEADEALDAAKKTS